MPHISFLQTLPEEHAIRGPPPCWAGHGWRPGCRLPGKWLPPAHPPLFQRVRLRSASAGLRQHKEGTAASCRWGTRAGVRRQWVRGRSMHALQALGWAGKQAPHLDRRCPRIPGREPPCACQPACPVHHQQWRQHQAAAPPPLPPPPPVVGLAASCWPLAALSVLCSFRCTVRRACPAARLLAAARPPAPPALSPACLRGPCTLLPSAMVHDGNAMQAIGMGTEGRMGGAAAPTRGGPACKSACRSDLCCYNADAMYEDSQLRLHWRRRRACIGCHKPRFMGGPGPEEVQR